MSKIDIAIKVTSDGASEPYAVHGGEWTRYAIDIRQLLDNLTGMDDYKQVARILSFTDDGCIVTLARLVPGRGGDNVAAWIFIPANADITGNEVVGIVEKTESVIASSQFDLQPLRELCDKEYPSRIPFSQAPTGNRLAIRRYDSASLPQLLGPYRYQPYYNDYRYILLLDDAGQIELRKEADADDLTRQLVGSISMLLPPKADDLHRQFGPSVSVTLADDTPFDHPVPVKKGESIKVHFVREGFKPVECTVRKNNDEAFAAWTLPDARSVRWMKVIDSSMFRFVDEQGRDLPADVHPTVRINGKKLSAAGMEMEERDLRQANVDASAKEQGYEGNARFVDFTEPAPYTLTLTRRVRDWKKKVKMRNGETAEMTLVSKYIPNHKNGPLMGYSYDPRTGNLAYDTGRVWAHRAQGLLAGLLLMGLCWGISAIVHSAKSKKQQQIEMINTPTNQVTDTLQSSSQQAGTTEGSAQQTTAEGAVAGSSTANPAATDEFSLQHAIDYLDNNAVWNRDEMERNPYLGGLFDDMNNFNLDELCGMWKDQLKDSKKFMDVADWAQSVKIKGKNPATGKHSPTYNQPGDNLIHRQNYINWLSSVINPPKAVTPAKSTQQPAAQGQGAKKAQQGQGKQSTKQTPPAPDAKSGTNKYRVG